MDRPKSHALFFMDVSRVFKKYRAISHENVAKMCFKLGITMPHEIHDDTLDVEIVDIRD